MSNSIIRVVQLINKAGDLSSPFQVYVRNDVTLGDMTVVSVRPSTSINPKTGEEREEMKVSADGIIRSHQREWFEALSEGFITASGYGVIVPMQLPSVDEVLAAL